MGYAISHVCVLDGTRDMEPRRDMTLVVGDDGTIEALCKDDEITLPLDMVEHELDGAYVAPGLINLQSHLVGDGQPRSKEDAVRLVAKAKGNIVGRSIVRNEVRKNAKDELNGGVTCVRAAGDPAWVDVALREDIRAGKLHGPRILACGPGITPVGGHGAGTVAEEAANCTEAMELVREAYAQGVDDVKLFVTGGAHDLDADGNPGAVQMREDMAKAIVATAKSLGLKTFAHAESTAGVEVALKAGVDSVEHGAALTPELIGLFKKNGQGCESTLTFSVSPAVPYAMMDPEETGVAPEVSAAYRKIVDGVVEGAKQARAAGVRIGLGADSGCPYVSQHDMWREVVYYDRFVCHDAREALHTATCVNAEILGIADTTGTLEKGKRADFVVLGENPLVNLETLKEPAMICVGGHMVTNPKPRRDDDIESELDAILGEL
jgi:imidazolonepropionase-like amidohydrolase